MISDAVMPSFYGNRKPTSISFPLFGIARQLNYRHLPDMIGSGELLARLKEAGARPTEIAKAMGVAPSRVTELYNGTRQLKLDEAVKLVDAFKLDESPARLNPVSTPIARLIVLHLAHSLGSEVGDSEVTELAEDLRAFSAFATNPRMRESLDAVEAFFESLRLRRQAALEDARSMRQAQDR
jgi:transcriptional regulator with XRE-family HTH domain